MTEFLVIPSNKLVRVQLIFFIPKVVDFCDSGTDVEGFFIDLFDDVSLT